MVRFHPPPPEAFATPNQFIATFAGLKHVANRYEQQSVPERPSDCLGDNQALRNCAGLPDEALFLLGNQAHIATWSAFQPVRHRALPTEPVVLKLVSASAAGL